MIRLPNRLASAWEEAPEGTVLGTRKHEDVILTTKVAGRSDRMTWLREDGSGTIVNRKQIL